MADEMRELTERLAKVEEELARWTEYLADQEGTASTWMAPLRVLDQEGRSVAEIVAREESAFIHLIGPAGEAVATLLAGQSGGELHLYNHEGQRVCMLAATADGGVLEILNAQGHKAVQLTADRLGNYAAVHDHSGKCAVSLAAQPLGGEVSVASPTEDRAATLWVAEEGGELTIFNKQREKVASLGPGDNGGRFTLLDRGGQLMFPWLMGGGLIGAFYVIQRLLRLYRGGDLWAYLGTLVMFAITTAAVISYGNREMGREGDSAVKNLHRTLWARKRVLHWPITWGTALLPGLWIAATARSPLLTACTYLLTWEVFSFLGRLLPRPTPMSVKPHLSTLLFTAMMLACGVLAGKALRSLLQW